MRHVRNLSAGYHAETVTHTRKVRNAITGFGNYFHEELLFFVKICNDYRFCASNLIEKYNWHGYCS